MPDKEAQNPSQARPDSDTPWNEATKASFDGKRFSEHYDPCQEAANKSIKCIHRNAGNKDLCNDYFQAYRDCKKAWIEARKEARRANGAWF